MQAEKDRQVRELVKRYKNGTASVKELKAFFGLIAANEITDELESDMDVEIRGMLEQNSSSQKTIWQSSWLRIAASLFVLLALGLYTYKSIRKEGIPNPTQNALTSSKNKATLVLADGRQISLSDDLKGKLAEEAGMSVLLTKEGQLTYHITEGNPSAQVTYNSLKTANAQQYQVILPDSTRVWLNSGSVLSYPTRFSGMKNRTVSLKGEAYFEVKKNKKQPFVVVTPHQLVQVLGTHFNVNAYSDEEVTRTTLAEGAVKVMIDGFSKILNPGQQAIVCHHKIDVQRADLEVELAWKNGDFVFRNEDFKTLMRKIGRWYDMEIHYDDTAPVSLPLTGQISRSKDITAILAVMEETGQVHFKIEGRRVLVTK